MLGGGLMIVRVEISEGETKIIIHYEIYDWGEPAVSYKWTGWVWEITGWSSRLLQENYRPF